MFSLYFNAKQAHDVRLSFQKLNFSPSDWLFLNKIFDTVFQKDKMESEDKDLTHLENLLATGGMTESRKSRELIQMAQTGNLSGVQLLIKSGADVNGLDATKETALIKATTMGHVDCVKELIRAGANVNNRLMGKRSPLVAACSFGQVECAQLLVEAGADVNKCDTNTSCALYSAAKWNHVDCVALLLASGADVNSCLQTKSTPLARAASRGNVRCVKLLLNSGADVNRSGEDGTTPLIEAANTGSAECLRILMASGANVNDANAKNGRTALMEAALWNHDSSCVDELLRAGADVNKYDSDGKSALMDAAWGRINSLAKLLEAGANVNTTDKYGRTALTNAIQNGSIGCFDIILEAGADINVLDILGNSPLNLAAKRNRTKCVFALLQGDALINVSNEDGHNALMNHIKYNYIPNEKITVVLYTAGESFGNMKIPKCLEAQIETCSDLNLKRLCRKQIREHLLYLRPQEILFKSVPCLGLPDLLSSYLLRNVESLNLEDLDK